MIEKTNFFVEQHVIDKAVSTIPTFDFKISFNNPSARFLYDPWIIKDEYKGSIWEIILNSLPVNIGEARLIKLDPGACYVGHADIDDRWHLTISSQQSYLIDLDDKKMYQTDDVGRWYRMDASKRHSAANFGSIPRFQLVVRQLLCKSIILNPVNVKLILKNVVEDRRYIFDDLVSPWLNNKNKQGLLDNFKAEEFNVTFITDITMIEDLKKLTNNYFNIEVSK